MINVRFVSLVRRSFVRFAVSTDGIGHSERGYSGVRERVVADVEHSVWIDLVAELVDVWRESKSTKRS